MKHEADTRAWRPARTRKGARSEARGQSDARARGLFAVWSALLFNVCLALLPASGAVAYFVIARDRLFSYENSEAVGRDVRTRVERLAGSLIMLDFDRRQQWDDLIARELMAGDISAARGFLLSGHAMLSPHDANQLNRRLRGHNDDAAMEAAALDLLTPGTRARYESSVPLLSRRSASGAAAPHAAEQVETLGDARDFELLARPILADGDSDSLRFVLTGLGLGLGGDFTPRMAAGATALIAAARHSEFPPELGERFARLMSGVVPVENFRAEARRRAGAAGDPAAYPNAAPAFRAAVDPVRAREAFAVLDEIGAMSQASSVSGAALLLTHARDLGDLARLRLLAEAAGDRAVAVAKNLPRDGRLPRAARGDLNMTRDLSLWLGLAALAVFGLAFAAFAASFQAVRRVFAKLRVHEDIASGELVRSFNPLRPL